MLREETPEENRERAAGDIEGGGADCLRPPGALRGQAHRGGGGAEEVHRHGEGVRRHHLHQELLRMFPSRGGDPAVAVQTVPAEDGASELCYLLYFLYIYIYDIYIDFIYTTPQVRDAVLVVRNWKHSAPN